MQEYAVPILLLEKNLMTCMPSRLHTCFFKYNESNPDDDPLTRKRERMVERYKRVKRRKTLNTEEEEEEEEINVVVEDEFLTPIFLEKETQTNDTLLQQSRSLVDENANLLIQLNENISDPLFEDNANTKYFRFSGIEDKDSEILFYTGLKNGTIFKWFFSLFKAKVKSVRVSLSLDDHLLLVLMKLRLGLLNKDLAYRFEINCQSVH